MFWPCMPAGIHPGWPNYDSPDAGYIFEIDIT